MLERYNNMLSDEEISEMRYRGERLSDQSILMVNTARKEGGVAQILKSLVPLLEDVNVSVDWKVLEEEKPFFDITKKLHNGLQGESVDVSESERRRYVEGNDVFWERVNTEYDFILVHDPQPCAIIDHVHDTPAVLRLHIDSSTPDPSVWDFLKPYIDQYDEAVVSKDEYYHDGLDVEHRVVRPATDPFSPINEPMEDKAVNNLLRDRVGQTKNLITQVSRFDKWKDPLGVIDVFEQVREERECTLLLLGSDAADDPEGQEIYEAVRDRRRQSPYAESIVTIMENNAALVNAAQRGSDVVIQKSLREGFGLTVSEAMLKGTPVVASDVGGIPRQIVHGETGFLHGPEATEAFASTINNLLGDEAMQDVIGENAKSRVQNEFVMTRLVQDYLDLFEDHLLDENTL